MIQISLKESLIIGIITILCTLVIQKFIDLFAEDEIKDSNIFTNNRTSILFYIMVFMIGIVIHTLVKYAQVNEWYCEKQCIDNVCEVVCHLPINGITSLMITK